MWWFSSAIPECHSDFQCDNGHCIPYSYVCDDEFDCGYEDNSDEENCEGRVVILHVCHVDWDK